MRGALTFFGFMYTIFAGEIAFADCAQLAASQKFREFKSLYAQTMTNRIDALGFRIYDHALVITAANTAPDCAILLAGAVSTSINLSQPLSISNGAFDFRNEWKLLSSTDEAALRTAVVDRGYTSFLIFNIDQKGKDPFSGVSSTSRFNFAFAIHEAFHFLRQINASLPFEHCSGGSTPCMDWTSREAKDFVNTVCYRKDSTVRQLLLEELRLLKAAYRSATDNNVAQARIHVRQFIASRKSRYSRLASQEFRHSSWRTSGNCEQAEAHLEWNEGAAQYVEVSYLRQLNQITPSDIVFALETGGFAGDLFYTLGTLQLTVLEKINPDFAAFKSRYLSSSVGPDDLHFRQLEKSVSVP